VLNQAPHIPVAALFWLQAERVKDHKRKRDSPNDYGPSSIDELERRGESSLNDLAVAFWERFNPCLFITPEQEALFFPEYGHCPFPVPGARPVLAMPVTTRMFLAFVDRSLLTPQRQAIEAQLNIPGRPTILSLGLTSPRVILPPEREEPPSHVIVEWRRRIRELHRAYGEASLAAGLDAWGPTDEETR
jgi:hypothetical protein